MSPGRAPTHGAALRTPSPGSPQLGGPHPIDPAAVDQTAVRVLEMVVLEEPDLPGWGDDDDVEEIIPAIPVPPAVPRPPAQPRRWKVRLGVGLGGVQLAKLPPGQLPTVQTPNDIGIMMGYAPGAVDWFAECVNNYEADSVFVLSVVHSKRLCALLLDVLFAQDGLLHAAGIPRATWFGQSPGQPNAGPLSRMTSPTSLMTKWR